MMRKSRICLYKGGAFLVSSTFSINTLHVTLWKSNLSSWTSRCVVVLPFFFLMLTCPFGLPVLRLHLTTCVISPLQRVL